MQTFLEYYLEQLDEVLSAAQRVKRKITFRRNSAKVRMGRRKADQRIASADTLRARAQRRSRAAEFKKLAKKGKSQTAYSARAGYEKLLKNRSSQIQTTARKLLPSVRAADRGK